MAETQLTATLRRVGALAATQQQPDRTDRELLQDFLGSNDHAAFAVLVKRYGPLVLGVCRRELPSREDAEDAFQATFLFLAQKAGSIRKREALSSWLHGVAHRMARNARRAAARRRKHETAAPTRPAPPNADPAWREVQGVLDEEIQRLPEVERVPFLLCFLDGRGRAEAATQLRLTPKTLERRLAQAKARMRQRLARRGLSLSAVLAAAALTPRTGVAALPFSLLWSTLSTVRLLAAGGSVPARVAALMKGVSKAMVLSTIKGFVVGAFVLGIAGGTAGLFSHPAPSDVAEPDRTTAPARVVRPAEPAPPPVEPPADEVDDIVARWSRAMARVKGLRIAVTRTTANKTFETSEVYNGTIQWLPAPGPGKPPRFRLELSKKGQPKTFEKFISDGTRLYEFAPRDKEIRVHALPLQVLGREFAFDDPFFFLGSNMKVGAVQKRYRLTCLPAPANDRWYVYLQMQPRRQADRNDFTRARLVLSRSTYLPRQLWWVQPNGNEVTWDFPRVIEDGVIPEAAFAAPEPPAGWRLTELGRKQ
jgi:TIGR03009 family protein